MQGKQYTHTHYHTEVSGILQRMLCFLKNTKHDPKRRIPSNQVPYNTCRSCIEYIESLNKSRFEESQKIISMLDLTAWMWINLVVLAFNSLNLSHQVGVSCHNGSTQIEEGGFIENSSNCSSFEFVCAKV